MGLSIESGTAIITEPKLNFVGVAARPMPMFVNASTQGTEQDRGEEPISRRHIDEKVSPLKVDFVYRLKT